MEFVRWGILSVSNNYHLRIHNQLKGSATVKVLGIASRNSAKAAAEAKQLGIPKSYGSYEALLADPEIDAVYIPLPNDLHAEWVKKAADAGKHVLCEKPFALDARQAEEAIGHAKARNVHVMEAFMYRFHPQWVHAREVIRSGELGQVLSVSAYFSYFNKDPANIRNILEKGGGGFMDIGCYAVSSARFLLGMEPRRVMALANRDPVFHTDVLSSGLLDFGSAHATFTVSTQAAAFQRIDVIGTDGTLSILIPFNMYDDLPAEIQIRTGVGERTVRLGPAGQYRLMFEAFSASILESNPEPTSPSDAVSNMKVLDALFRSEKSGIWEAIL
ncbi:MAG: Gfo/Idh/MocA family oxidoreductase [Spirochaetaceae bacterium]|nr:Gfo/Idh/MocA family oxidoreductase [Spirochaetaceae bacterium]